MSETLLPVSKGALALGEWNNNFNGALAIADAHHVPLLVFYGGLSCGKCEELQRACLTDEFLAWQREHRMLMVFTTNNALGDASGFAKPLGSTGFPFIAVYWNRAGDPPQNGVHKSLEPPETALFRQLHCLTDHGARRNPVHVQQLVNAHAQDVPDHRLHLPHLHAGPGLQDPVRLYQILQGPVDEPRKKSTVLC